VSGLTKKLDQRRRGSTLLSTASTAIGESELGPLDLAAQYLELLAEHGDLDVLGVLPSQAPEQHADESAGHEVKGQGHRRIIAWPILAAQREVGRRVAGLGLWFRCDGW
jgi:hypothetical protein